MNPIAYLSSHGFKITSDPSKYRSGIWGLRNYTVNGYNYDAYCQGYHRAYDLVKYNRAPIPAVFGGIVTVGTSSYGNFGCTVVIANKELGYQVIYGHLARPLKVRVGEHVKQGGIIGFQSNTNYQNVRMDSHLHIQFQRYGFLPNERNFVCTGITPLTINVNQKGYHAAWLWSGIFTATEIINIRSFPSQTSVKKGMINKGEKLKFDKLYDNNGYWWLRCIHNGGQIFIACGKKVPGIIFTKTKLYGEVSQLNTSKGKE